MPTLPTSCRRHERRLETEILECYDTDRSLEDVAEAWRHYRTWAAVHLRSLREQHTNDTEGASNR